jgi:hypothetical protein
MTKLLVLCSFAKVSTCHAVLRIHSWKGNEAV